MTLGRVDGNTENGNLVVNVQRKDTTDCIGNLPVQSCTLNPGVVMYNVSLDNGTVSFATPSWRDDKFLRPT